MILDAMVKINLKNSNLGQHDKLTEYILEYAKNDKFAWIFE